MRADLLSDVISRFGDPLPVAASLSAKRARVADMVIALARDAGVAHSGDTDEAVARMLVDALSTRA